MLPAIETGSYKQLRRVPSCQYPLPALPAPQLADTDDHPGQVGVVAVLMCACLAAAALEHGSGQRSPVELKGAFNILSNLEKSMDQRIDWKVKSFMQGPAEVAIPVSPPPPPPHLQHRFYAHS